jgi:hypothetical protein
VPSGRLSCAACGTLLASVAGAPRRPTARDAAAGAGDAPEVPGDVVDAASAASKARGAAAAEWTAGMDAAEDHPPTPPILQDWTGPMPVGVVDATGPTAGPKVAHPNWSPAAWTSPPPASQDAPLAEPPGTESSDAWDTRPDDADLDRRPVASQPAREPEAEPTWPGGPDLPGSYVAPSIVPTAASTIHGRPATATAIAAAAVADGTLTSISAEPRPDHWFSVPDPTKDGSTPGKAGIFSDLPFRTPKDLPGWAVAVGSLVGAVAFLLPWSANGVLGGGVDQTYTGQWGLANTANLLPMVASIAVLFLTLIANPIPVSIRRVVLPILLGGWFIGILWSYATGPFGLGWGVDAIGVAAIVMVIGAALAAARADDPPKLVRQKDAAQP